MRSKLLIIAILTLISFSSAYAKKDITGDIYGQIFKTMNMEDSGFPYGVTIDDLGDAENCDNNAQTCPLDGLSWSDVMGWTYWDGNGLQDELGVLDFPDEHMGKITYNGNLEGYIWGEKYGWVSLSACTGLDNASCGLKSYCNWSVGSYCEASTTTRVPDVSSQDVDDWGAYLDFCPLKQTQGDCESVTSDQYCDWDAGDTKCIFDEPDNPSGQPFGGYAWSEYLGWIKFGPETGEETDFSGAFTRWVPDLTTPEITIPNPDPNQSGNWDPSMDPLKLWIPNESHLGNITWESFMNEDDSFVDLESSTLAIETIENGPEENFAGCPEPISDQQNGNAIIVPSGGGKIDLLFQRIGQIGVPPYGFCKYEISGVIYNGSGFGFYFGETGTDLANGKSIDLNDPAPNVYDVDPITIFVRAGDPDTPSSSVFSANNDQVADGNNPIGISFHVSGQEWANRIVSVKADITGKIWSDSNDSNKWIRKVELLYDLTSSQYNFDSINWTRDLFPLPDGIPIPIAIQGDSGYTNYNKLEYPPSGKFSFTPLPDGSYTLDLTGYAPTTTDGNSLEIDNVEVTTNDIELLAISPTQGPWAANSIPFILDSSFIYKYKPALKVTNGYLDSDFLSISQAAEATFEFTNNSTDPLVEYSFDHILSFTDGGIGAELLEIKDIDLIPIGDDTGRTDSNDSGVATRYGLLYSSPSLPNDDEENNRFHSNTGNYHDPTLIFENPANNDGVYIISAYVEPGHECLEPGPPDPPDCPTIEIDRSDLLTTDVLDPSGSPTANDSFTFAFTPARFFAGSSSGNITFDLDQYLSYLPPNSPFSQYALYPAEPFIQDIQVKSLGIDTSGTVSGGQIYEGGGGRDLDTITTTSSADLRREIRKNVAVLTRNLGPCAASDEPIRELSTINGGCIAVDKVNRTVVAYYNVELDENEDEEDELDTLILNNDGNNIVIPNGYRYTLILDGANLSIEDNIVYPTEPIDPNTSFGMIVIQDSDGNGGNVYLGPDPTNIVGLLYAEGSLLSRNAAGQFYYGAGGISSDLGNQLYWQGSIATKNTIGGASALVTPEADDPDSDECDFGPWATIAQCSQAYDLDFIRRFTTINESGVEYSPFGSFFSGGGKCVEGPPITCDYGGLPTTVALSGNSIGVAISESLGTFFIERDNRPVPPGFSSSGGFTSTKEIR